MPAQSLAHAAGESERVGAAHGGPPGGKRACGRCHGRDRRRERRGDGRTEGSEEEEGAVGARRRREYGSRRDWAHPGHIGTGTWLTPATYALRELVDEESTAAISSMRRATGITRHCNTCAQTHQGSGAPPIACGQCTVAARARAPRAECLLPRAQLAIRLRPCADAHGARSDASMRCVAFGSDARGAQREGG